MDVNLQDSTKIKWEFQKVNEENSQELNYSNTKYEIMTNKSLRIEAPTGEFEIIFKSEEVKIFTFQQYGFSARLLPRH